MPKQQSQSFRPFLQPYYPSIANPLTAAVPNCILPDSTVAGANCSNFLVPETAPFQSVVQCPQVNQTHDTDWTSACSDSFGSMEFDGWEIDRSEIMMRHKLGEYRYSVFKNTGTFVFIRTLYNFFILLMASLACFVTYLLSVSLKYADLYIFYHQE